MVQQFISVTGILTTHAGLAASSGSKLLSKKRRKVCTCFFLMYQLVKNMRVVLGLWDHNFWTVKLQP